MTQPFDLRGQFLISMPGLTGSFFERSVIVMCEHDSNGALGFALNKPSDFSLLTLFRDMDLAVTDALGDVFALLGGPVETQRGFILSRHAVGQCSEATDGLYINTHTSDLVAYTPHLISGEALFVLGYSGWDADQLAQEVRDNAWLAAPYRGDLAFSTPRDSLLERTVASLGFSWNQLTATPGHA